ncbi:MAG: cytochrome c3 family protein [Candidatus Krumholzibacteriia bacterium]
MRSHSLLPLLLALLCAAAVVATADDGAQAAHRDADLGNPHDTFEHREAAGVACTVCHACEEPTLADPCLAACPRHGGHFYGKHSSDDGPEVVVIDQLADMYRPVVFAHKLHAGMADMNGGCTNCHHYSERSGAIPACRECHDPDKTQVDIRMPSLKGAYHRQCINCHLDWSHDNACGFCHQPAGDGTAVIDTASIVGVPHPNIEATETYTYETSYAKGPVVSFHHADHVDLFGQQCVDCHRGNSCARCHDSSAGATSRALDHVTDCLSCHAERNCAFCHTTAPKPRFDHTKTVGWSLAPFHTKVACTTCHGDPKNFHRPTGACGDCHIHWETGSFNHRVTGLALNADHVDLDCGDCHIDRAFERKPSCLNCHDEELYPKSLPGEKVKRR